MTTMKRTIVGIVSALLLLSVVMAGSAAAAEEYSGSSYFNAGNSFTTGYWNGDDTVNISINPRSGNGIIVVNYSVQKGATVVPADVLRELGLQQYSSNGGFQAGWNTDKEDFSVEYEMDDAIPVTDNLTFYAVWVNNGGTTNVTMYNQATFSFVIPSDIILSNEVNGLVGANVTIIPGEVREASKDIVMRLNSTGYESGSIFGDIYYGLFSVTLNGAPKTADNSADYMLYTYDDAAAFYAKDEKKEVFGSQNKEGGYDGYNNIVIGYKHDEEGSPAQVTDYLGFKTVELPKKAGTYVGTLTFTVGIEQPPVEP